MILTEAPKDFGGRLRRNCALTTPELPIQSYQHRSYGYGEDLNAHTVRSCNLAPNYSNLGPAYFPLRPVDECDFLAEIETRGRQKYQNHVGTRGGQMGDLTLLL